MFIFPSHTQGKIKMAVFSMIGRRLSVWKTPSPFPFIFSGFSFRNSGRHPAAAHPSDAFDGGPLPCPTHGAKRRTKQECVPAAFFSRPGRIFTCCCRFTRVSAPARTRSAQQHDKRRREQKREHGARGNQVDAPVALRSGLRHTDRLCRLGGDIFALHG